MVRKIVYSKTGATVPISGVQIKAETESLSDAKGLFSLSVTTNANSQFTLTRIFKEGYALISPKPEELGARKYPINTSVNIEVILAKTDELNAERRRIESNIRKEKEAEIAAYKEQIARKDSELQKLKESDARFKRLLQERDSIEAKYQHFTAQYYDSDKFIMDEADELSRIDFQSLDSMKLINTELRKRGKGKELVERNRISSSEAIEIERLVKSREHAAEYLQKTEKNIHHWAERYKALADGYRLEYKNDSAAICLIKRAGLDQSEYRYQFDCAAFLQYLARYEEALEYYKRALTLAVKQYGKSSEQVAASYNGIGLIYNSQGNYPLALEYYEQSLAIRKTLFGLNHPHLATSYNNIGLVYYSQGNYPLALEYYERSLAIYKAVFGLNHPYVAASYNNIGSVYHSQGNYPLALEYYERFLTIYKAVFGSHHPDVATSYNNIGFVHYSQGNYPLALEYYEQSLAIRKAVFGLNHPDVATSYNNIGLVHYSQANYPLALEYYEQSLAICKAVYGVNHPNVATSYNNIGLVQNALGNYSLALEHYEQFLAIYEVLFALNHPYVATAYCNIGSVYKSLGNYPLALEYYEQAFVIRNAAFGLNHSFTVSTYISQIHTLTLLVDSLNAVNNKTESSKYMQQLHNTLENCAFTVKVQEGDSQASRKGLDGVYYVLYYEGWECTDNKDLFSHAATVKEKPRKLVLMKESEIREVQLGREELGLQVSLEIVSKKEKDLWAGKYKNWKAKQK